MNVHSRPCLPAVVVEFGRWPSTDTDWPSPTVPWRSAVSTGKEGPAENHTAHKVQSGCVIDYT